MLPLSLIRAAVNHPMLVELKNGESYNGHLVNCDHYMNIILRGVTLTSKDGDRFWKLKECYIRGSTIKYLRLPDEIIDMVIQSEKRPRGGRKTRGRGGGRGRGRGRGGRGRGGGRA